MPQLGGCEGNEPTTLAGGYPAIWACFTHTPGSLARGCDCGGAGGDCAGVACAPGGWPCRWAATIDRPFRARVHVTRHTRLAACRHTLHLRPRPGSPHVARLL